MPPADGTTTSTTALDPTANGTARPGWVYAIFAALAVSSVYTAVRSLEWPMVRDAPIMHYIGWEILSGAAPYKDLFDMNMPGTYLIHMFIIKFFGPGVVAWHLFNVAWALLTVALIAAFCAPYGRWSVAAASLLFACHYFGGHQTHVGQRDFLLGPFLMLAAYGWARYLETDGRARFLLIAALAVGMAVTIKPIAVVLLAFIVVSHVLKTRRAARRFIVGSASLIGGALVAPAAVLLWLWSTGSVESMWQVMTRYLPLYAHLGGATKMPMALGLGSRVAILVPLVPFARTLIGKRPADPFRRYSVLVACAGYGVLHFVLQGKGWYYHLYPINLFLLTLTGMMLGDVMRDGVRRTRTLATIMLALVSLPLAGRCVWQGRTPVSAMESWPRVTQLVADISEYSLASTDKVQVLDGTEGGIHALYLLKIHQPTRFVYDMYFYHDMDKPLVQGLRRELIEGMSRDLPRLVVQFDDTWVQPQGFSKLVSFPELAGLLDEHYRKDKSHLGYTLYVAK